MYLYNYPNPLNLSHLDMYNPIKLMNLLSLTYRPNYPLDLFIYTT